MSTPFTLGAASDRLTALFSCSFWSTVPSVRRISDLWAYTTTGSGSHRRCPGKTHTGKHILHTPHKTALFHGEPISPRAHLAKKPARFFHSSKPFQRRLRTALRFLLRNGWPQAPVFSRRPEHKRKFRRAARLKDVFTQKYVSAAHNSPSSFLRRPVSKRISTMVSPATGVTFSTSPAAENFMLTQVSRTIGSAALRRGTEAALPA